jgi:hypothetical protein
MRIAVIASEDEAQGRAAAQAASRWFDAGAPRACAKVRTLPNVPATGRLDLRRPLRGPSRARVLLSNADSAMLDLAACVLRAPEGLLDEALAGAAGASSSVRRVGPRTAPLLAVDVSAPDQAIDAAVEAAMALVSRLARGEVPDAELAAARRRCAAAERDRLRDPGARVGSLFTGAAQEPRDPPAADAFRTWAKAALLPARALVVTVRPE